MKKIILFFVGCLLFDGLFAGGYHSDLGSDTGSTVSSHKRDIRRKTSFGDIRKKGYKRPVRINLKKLKHKASSVSSASESFHSEEGVDDLPTTFDLPENYSFAEVMRRNKTISFDERREIRKKMMEVSRAIDGSIALANEVVKNFESLGALQVYRQLYENAINRQDLVIELCTLNLSNVTEVREFKDIIQGIVKARAEKRKALLDLKSLAA
ncbi:hypothetical protein FJ366_02060 [Candidatus Dependentiae bacterium]|nr:hypothetical protein [Candidatus Dependentiae bacterium]